MYRLRTTAKTLPSAALLWLALAASACVDDGETSRQQLDDDFAEAFEGFDSEFGDGKEDFFGFDLDVEPCRLLGPLLVGGDELARSAFFAGATFEGSVGFDRGFVGYDIVFDFFHRQITVSEYAASGIGVPVLGTELMGYVGFATGFDHGVSDWDGHFVHFEGGLDFASLAGFLEFGAAVTTFASAEDLDGDGEVSYSETILPPDGVYGFSFGITLTVNLLPDIVPVSGETGVGEWTPLNEGIRYVYESLLATRFFQVGTGMSVHLVDAHDGTPCSASWPEAEPERHCVVEIGEQGWSNTHAAAHFAYAICSLTGGCALPTSWPLASMALAVGAYQDFEGSFAEMCQEDDFH